MSENFKGKDTDYNKGDQADADDAGASGRQNLYFSGALTAKLAELHECSLAMVEAPAGYGKTTAVLRAMGNVPADRVHWFTAVSFLQDVSIDWFIRQIGMADGKAGAELRALGFLNRSNAGEAADIIAAADVKSPCYIIMDNFQMIGDNWPLPLLMAMADRKRDGLHVILISQNFGKLRAVFESNSGVLRFRAQDFLLARSSIMEYGKQLGLDLSKRQAEAVCRDTEGWAAAVSLYLENMLEKGNGVSEFRDMDGLLYELLWQKISDKEREMLMRIAVLDCIRDDQIPVIAAGYENEMKEFLVRIPLLRRDSRAGAFYPHEILRKFLRKRLESMPAEFISSVYELSGDIYRKAGNRKMATECFFHAGDYEALLSGDLTGLLSEQFEDMSYTQMAGDILMRCSEEILERYPVSMLRLCMALFAGTDFEGFQREIVKCRNIIDRRNAADRRNTAGNRNIADNVKCRNDEAEKKQILGEWYMVAAFLEFPDIPGMKNYYMAADDLMCRPSEIFTCREPYMFGTTSMWYLFYRTPGKMMETADELKDMLEVYNRLTDHHAAGAYEMYLGEALSVQGRFDESDIYAHRAAMLSERWKNASITYGAALLLGINAIYQSDMISLQKAIEYLETKALAYPFLRNTALNRQMAETVRTYLLGLMMEPDRSAKWARGPADMLGDLTFTNFMAKTNRITDLILRKEYKRAIASVEASLNLDSRLISLSTRNFMYVGLSLCYLAIGSIPGAAEWLDKSLSLAGKDKNYTFLACFRKYLSVLFILPSIRKKHAKTIREIKELEIHYTKAEESRIFSMLEKHPDQMDELSGREREVALLAAEGLRNREIAEKLFISEETVKTHIKSIFKKMNIDRRSKLVNLLK